MTDPAPGADPASPRVVFLVGAPRSGTTWLQSLLGAHPADVTPQETDLFAAFVGPLQEAWDTQAARSPAEQRARRLKGLPAILDDDQYAGLLGELVTRVLGAIHALDPAASVIVEKSPAHSRYVELIARYLPDATFVHLVRDGRDVVASLQSASRGWGAYWAPDAVKRGAQVWQTNVLGARRAAGTPGFSEVRYEDLRAGDPAPLQQAFASCGLTVDTAECAALLQQYSLERMAGGAVESPIAVGGSLATHDTRQEPEGFFGKGEVGGWAGSWSDDDRMLFDAIAGDLLVDLGYEPDHEWAGTAGRRAWYARRAAAARLAGRAGRRVGRRLARRSERLLARLPDTRP
jgi:hypothetical protein